MKDCAIVSGDKELLQRLAGVCCEGKVVLDEVLLTRAMLPTAKRCLV